MRDLRRELDRRPDIASGDVPPPARAAGQTTADVS
jgi:hypothetical protein